MVIPMPLFYGTILLYRIDNIRTDYINKIIAEIVKTKPSYITIEDLNVSGMMKNRHLSKAVASQKFYEFRSRLKAKCDANGIEGMIGAFSIFICNFKLRNCKRRLVAISLWF